MHELLCILLWLVTIQSPGTYSEAQIYAVEDANQSEVDAIRSDPNELANVVAAESDKAELVWVYDYDGP